MDKSMKAVKMAIRTYLDNRAKTDELFAVAYAKPNKNIDECMKYILGEAKKWEAQYQETKGKFFGICFGNENIVITVIQSVAEMAEEGHAMHHCVYQNGYYKKPNSLILSAKSKDGKRIETIEIDLKTFSLIQSRGVCNQNTKHHNEIIKLVEENINLIKQVA